MTVCHFEDGPAKGSLLSHSLVPQLLLHHHYLQDVPEVLTLHLLAVLGDVAHTDARQFPQVLWRELKRVGGTTEEIRENTLVTRLTARGQEGGRGDTRERRILRGYCLTEYGEPTTRTAFSLKCSPAQTPWIGLSSPPGSSRRSPWCRHRQCLLLSWQWRIL